VRDIRRLLLRAYGSSNSCGHGGGETRRDSLSHHIHLQVTRSSNCLTQAPTYSTYLTYLITLPRGLVSLGSRFLLSLFHFLLIFAFPSSPQLLLFICPTLIPYHTLRSDRYLTDASLLRYDTLLRPYLSSYDTGLRSRAHTTTLRVRGACAPVIDSRPSHETDNFRSKGLLQTAQNQLHTDRSAIVSALPDAQAVSSVTPWVATEVRN
jgi:hypothetical protein